MDKDKTMKPSTFQKSKFAQKEVEVEGHAARKRRQQESGSTREEERVGVEISKYERSGDSHHAV